MKPEQKETIMPDWFVYAIGAAILYGLHQIFTKLAAERISDGLGGFVVEGSAALTILIYLALLKFSGHWEQKADAVGVWWSVGIDETDINSFSHEFADDGVIALVSADSIPTQTDDTLK